MAEYNDEYIEQLVLRCEQAAISLYKNNIEEAQQEIGGIWETVRDIYTKMIQTQGSEIADIPVEVLYSQLKNLIEAMKCRDILALADTLYYEIREGLLFYQEIKGMV